MDTETREKVIVGAVIAVPILITVAVLAVLVAWPSYPVQYMTVACDGLRDAHASIAEADRAGVEKGERAMSALDPAGDGEGEGDEVDQADLQKGWAAQGALRRILTRWDETPGPDAVSESDQPFIDRGLETCERFDYAWYSPYQVIASP